MSNITKHDTEQEWESYYGKYSRIDFLVHRDTIGVNDLLESSSELIWLDVCGWCNSVIFKSLKVSSGVVLEYFSDLSLLETGAPEISNVGSLTLSHIVQSVI